MTVLAATAILVTVVSVVFSRGLVDGCDLDSSADDRYVRFLGKSQSAQGL